MAEREVSDEVEQLNAGGYGVTLLQHLGKTIASVKFGHVLVWDEQYRHAIEPIEGSKNTRLRIWVKLEDNPLYLDGHSNG